MNSRTSYFVLRTSLILSSAILLALAFSSFNLGFLAWFAFAGLLFALEEKTKLGAFLISFSCGFLFFTLSMYWLVYVTPTGWLALSLYQALYFGIFGLTFAYFLRTPNSELRTPNYLAPPSAWVILEYVRANLAGGIGWNLLGYSQYKNLPIIQLADITGVWGVSFLIMLMNIAVYGAIKMAINCYRTDSKFKIKTGPTFMQELKTHPVMQTFIVLVIFVCALIYGYTSIASYETIPSEKIKISIVQGNVQQMLKWNPEFKNEIMNRYEDLTIKAAKDKPNLIIWPETAVPGYLNYDKELMQWIKSLIRKIKIPIFLGAPMISEEDKDYNSAALFSDKGEIVGQYNKLHLVAFGEFIPFEKQLPFLRKLFPITGSFIPGDEYTIFHLRTTNYELPPSARLAKGGRTPNFSALICFEDIFPGLVRGFARRGADFMVNITNDAWFGKTCAAYQHAACSVLRAVENRRPFIRSANTGLSCFIDKTGRIYEKVSKDGEDLFIEGIKTALVETGKDKSLTFYTRCGDIFILFYVIIYLILIAGKISLTIK